MQVLLCILHQECDKAQTPLACTYSVCVCMDVSVRVRKGFRRSVAHSPRIEAGIAQRPSARACEHMYVFRYVVCVCRHTCVNVYKGLLHEAISLTSVCLSLSQQTGTLYQGRI